jgi:hypothetical protein
VRVGYKSEEEEWDSGGRRGLTDGPDRRGVAVKIQICPDRRGHGREDPDRSKSAWAWPLDERAWAWKLDGRAWEARDDFVLHSCRSH